MRMSKRVFAGGFVVTVMAAGSVQTTTGVWARQQPAAIESKVVEPALQRLDDCIQERFKDAELRFGIARVTNSNSPHRFVPENAKEEEEVRALDRAQLDVVLYLAGLQLLSGRTETARRDYTFTVPILHGPVHITSIPPTGATPQAPAALDLLDEGRTALRSFRERDRYDFTKGEWRFVARPVPASAEECLACHRGEIAVNESRGARPGWKFKIGDPLGIVLYGYRPRR